MGLGFTPKPLAIQKSDCNTICAGIHPAEKVHALLMTGLQDVHTWKECHHKAEELLKEMLQSRSEAAELSKKYDARWVP